MEKWLQVQCPSSWESKKWAVMMDRLRDPVSRRPYWPMKLTTGTCWKCTSLTRAVPREASCHQSLLGVLVSQIRVYAQLHQELCSLSGLSVCCMLGIHNQILKLGEPDF
jgi:hypothetical protein